MQSCLNRSQTHKSSISNSILCSKTVNTRLYINKQYIKSQIWQGLPGEFIVTWNSNWSVHPVNITNIKYIKTNYIIIAESENNPLIIQHLSAVGTQFYIEKKNKDTVQLLTNFVEKSVNDIINKGRNDMNLEEANSCYVTRFY